MLSRLPRSGFTLIELLLSVAVCMILLGGLYFAVDIQVRSTRTGREVVDEAMVARAVLDLIARDIESFAIIEAKGVAAGSTTGSGSGTVDAVAFEFNATHAQEIRPVEILIVKGVV